MATAAKYPSALLALVDVGGELPGFPEAVLSGAHNAAVTTITLTATVPTAWPTAGWVTIDSEIIQYGGKSGATLTSCTRGSQSAYGGSAAATHADTAKVGFYLTPQAVNQMIADLIAVQTQLGLNFTPGDGLGKWLWDWDGKATIESTLVGTGTYAVATPVLTYASFLTGATSGGSSAGRVQIGSAGTGFNGVGKLRLAKLQLQHGHIDANTNSIVYITDESVVGNPSSSARHLGLRQTGATIYFSTGDNTNEQTTDISAFVLSGTDNFYDITYDGTTARCYVNNVLRATHTTYVPAATASAQPNFRIYIVNAAAASKAIYPSKAHLVFAV